MFGFLQTRDADTDVFPEFAPPIIEVQTLATGNSSTEVEELITIPIEDALNGIEGLDEMRSYSVEQVSSIKLYFKRGTDRNQARQLVQERLAGVTSQLPTVGEPAVHDAAPVVDEPDPEDRAHLGRGVPDRNVGDLLLEDQAAPHTRPGVAQVLIYGERLKQRHVQVDPRMLAENGVSLNQVMETTANSLDAGVLQFRRRSRSAPEDSSSGTVSG